MVFLCLLFWEDSGEMTGKYWGGERGAGSAKYLEAGIELGSLCAQLCCMSMHLFIYLFLNLITYISYSYLSLIF